MELAQGTWGTQAPCPVCLFQSPCKQLYRAASSKTLLIISFPNRKGYIWESEFDWVLNIEDNWPECRRNPSVWRQRSWSRDEQNSSAEQTNAFCFLSELQEHVKTQVLLTAALSKDRNSHLYSHFHLEGCHLQAHFKRKPNFSKFMIVSDCSAWHDPCLLRAFPASAETKVPNFCSEVRASSES